MTAIALRSLAARKLRTALTAIAVLLGVAMVSGTYIETDQIREAFEGISEQSVEGIDVVVSPREEFTAAFAEIPTIDEGLVRQIERVEGVEAAEGQATALGRIVVDGETVDTLGAPGLVLSAATERFDPTETVAGRDPRRSGEAAVLEQNADENGIELGDRIGVTTRSGVRPVTVVGIVRFGEGGSSLGGTTAVEIVRPQLQRWFDLRGKVTSINVIAAPGTDPATLARRIEAALPSSARAQTAEESADESAKEINDQIGAFLTPALLALAGAAVLVGAFIIFNTFSITVAQRMREFAMLRALGATRAQVLAAVTAEALIIGVVASLAGLGIGVGFSKLLNNLFDAVGFGIPRSGLVIAPRTIIVALVIGIGVTVIAALIPALRATRVAPVAAMSTAPAPPSARRRRASAIAAFVLLAAGAALAAQGLFGSGPATAKLGAIAGGAIAIFVGIALAARYLVRPLAAVIGAPIEAAFGTPGRLARENAVRNPSRTAVTSAALMVGVGLVVFVAVFAAGLKTSIGQQVDELIAADVFIYDEGFQPLPAGAVKATEDVDGVAAALDTRFDQLEVEGEKSNILYDLLIGVEPSKLPAVYTFDWIEGDDSLIDQLGPGKTLIEEQFAKAHDIGVGDSYSVTTPSGGRAQLTAIGIYRDPTILQGSLGSLETLASISPARDPLAILVAIDDDASPAAVEARIKRALESFPTVKVESKAEYKESLESRLNQIVYLLYALLALSVVISLFGIANSLFLSIHERTGELGILRAIGATGGQIRRIIRYESVITAVIGGVLGTAVGVLFAFLVIQSLSELGLEIAVPVGQLVLCLVLSVVVGVIGAIAPARRASGVEVLEAIHHE